MDQTDQKVQELVRAVHDTIAALDELVFTLSVAHRSPKAVEAEALLKNSLDRARQAPLGGRPGHPAEP